MKIFISIFFCLYFTTISISQTEDCIVHIPSLFVTEEDQFGETYTVWIIELSCPAEKASIQLYNRFGKKLIEKDEFNVQDVFKIDGTEIKSQSLFYSLTVQINGEEKVYNGVIIR